MLQNLPIDEIRDELVKGLVGEGAVQSWRVLVKAPTGSGKSTGVPSMLLDTGVEGLIVVVQPRRIAARMLAKRVASLRGVSVGSEVGYVVRFDNKMCISTRIVFVTDGVLERWLAENPSLDNVGAVVFDEFHERRIAMDVALADCLNLQEGTRPDLKVCVMSATLEVAGLNDYLSPCRMVEAGGRTFPVEIEYQLAKKSQKHSRYGVQEEPVWEKCSRAFSDVLAKHGADECGNVLIFLPGVYEIQRTVEQLERMKLKGWEICPLYGTLKPEQQDRAVRDGGGRRIIVSTNVAETSLTIPGVKTVIDAGLARVAVFDAVRGVDTLFVKKISRASAEQRSGRAGRVSAGRAVRLWSAAEHGRRIGFELPEVQRVDVSELVLRLLARPDIRCVDELSNFRWLDAPSEDGVGHAVELLESLGAVSDGEISECGERMSKMGFHPRVARLILAAADEGCLAEAVFVAATMQGEGLFLRGKSDDRGRGAFVFPGDESDYAALWRAFESARAMRYDPRRCNEIGVMARAAREISLSIKQLEKAVSRLMGSELCKVDFDENARAFSRAMLVAFSDRVAVKMGEGTLACRVSGGRTGKIDAHTAEVVKESEIFLVSDMTEVGAKDVTVHLNGCVTVDLLDVRDLQGESFHETQTAVYDEKIRRIVNRSEVKFKDLVISSKDGGDPDAEMAAVILAEKVASGELKLKKWDTGVEQWIARLLCLREWMPELELPGFNEEDRALALEVVCQGALGYKQIKDKDVMPALRGWLSDGQLACLDAYAPTRIVLENGQGTKVKYEVGKPPSIAQRVQKLYGVAISPTLANGNVTIQVHICAPNQRPWQMTQDLSSFWKNGFLQMKKDLAGRYPKHDWSGGGHI